MYSVNPIRRFEASYLESNPKILSFSQVENARIERARQEGRKEFAMLSQDHDAYEEPLVITRKSFAAQPRAFSGHLLLPIQEKDEVSPVLSSASTLGRSSFDSPWDLNAKEPSPKTSPDSYGDGSWNIWGRPDGYKDDIYQNSADLFAPVRTELFMVSLN
jgi:hypothetical protein